jgi:hypothetical protein
MSNDETGEATATEVGRLQAPWGKEVVVQSLTYHSGMHLARLRIREGHRFTLLDLDSATAAALSETLRTAFAQPGAEANHD